MYLKSTKISILTEGSQCLPGARGGGEDWLQRGVRDLSGDRNVLHLDCGKGCMNVHIYICQTVHLK